MPRLEHVGGGHAKGVGRFRGAAEQKARACWRRALGVLSFGQLTMPTALYDYNADVGGGELMIWRKPWTRVGVPAVFLGTWRRHMRRVGGFTYIIIRSLASRSLTHIATLLSWVVRVLRRGICCRLGESLYSGIGQ